MKRATHLDSVEARSRLKPRRDPYWQRLSEGRYIGFRKMTARSAGSWLARYYDGAKYPQDPLGDFDDLDEGKRYDAAVRAATEWFKHKGAGGSTRTITVRGACELYLQHVRDDHEREEAARNKTADDIEARYGRHVYKKPIASIDLPKLLKAAVEKWRKDLAKQPAKRGKKGIPRPRSASDVNRNVTALRSALNHAHESGYVTSDLAWKVALKPTKNADGSRDVYLDRDERKRLLECVRVDLAPFLKGLALVPLRPGALASLTAADFNERLGVLTIGIDKAGKGRKITLPPATAAFFAEQAKDKLPSAPLFARADGKAWDKDSWKGPIKDAAAAAGLPASVTAYAMRHAGASDLVAGGVPLLTIAQLSGTSVAMIERHYGHLLPDRGAAALARLAL